MRVNIDIDLAKLALLINSGALCIADLHALDAKSKNALWKLCLHCAKHSIASELAAKECRTQMHLAHYCDGFCKTNHR